MIRFILFVLFCLLVGLVFSLCSGCTLIRKAPPKAMVTQKAGQAAPLEKAVAVSNNAVVKADSTNKAVADAELLFKQKMAANLSTSIDANLGNTPGFPRDVVAGELGIAQARLLSVVPDMLELAAGAKRRADVEAGKAEEARIAYQLAVVDAKKIMDENLKLKVAHEIAQSDLTRARQMEATALADYQIKLVKNQQDNQSALDKLIRSHQEELDKEKRAFMRTIGRVLLGLGTLLILAGIFLTYGGLQAGDPFKALIKGVCFGAGAAFCFATAWTLNQPWFKYVVISGLSVIVLTVVLFIWISWREAMEKKDAARRAREADEAEDTLKKVIKVLDKKPEDDPVFTELGKEMQLNNKALVHELRAEDQRAKAAPTP